MVENDVRDAPRRLPVADDLHPLAHVERLGHVDAGVDVAAGERAQRPGHDGVLRESHDAERGGVSLGVGPFGDDGHDAVRLVLVGIRGGIDVDGSWRIGRVGNNWEMQRHEAGAYVGKAGATAS